MAAAKSKMKDVGKAKGRGDAPNPGKKVKDKKSAAEIKREKDLARLKAWKEKARKDPTYRKREAAAERKRKQALHDDAEFGRVCRMFFDSFKQMLEFIQKGTTK